MTDDLKSTLLLSNFSIEELFILTLLYEDTEYLKEYITKNKYKINFNNILINLKINGYITFDKPSNLDNIIILIPKDNLIKFNFDNLIDISPAPNKTFELMWSEFISLYPKKAGHRPLHTNKDKCKDKYRNLIKYTSHEDILKGLQMEIDLREKARIKKEFFPEWKLMPTYLNQKGWEAFLELNEEDTLEFHNDGRITRKL